MGWTCRWDEREGTHTDICWRNILGNVHLEEKEGDWSVTLRWTLGREFVRNGDE
jgi:hypothetical protein